MDRTREELEGKHWIEVISEEIISTKKPPIIITGAMTTSGPAHFGTVCELLYPYMIEQKLKQMKIATEFHFIADILDAFDNIPIEMEKYKDILQPELGKPLVYALDPQGCHLSFGEHYLAQAESLMKFLSLDIDVVIINKLYDSGKFDKYAILFLNNEEQTKQIVAETSMRDIETMQKWSPIMPICESCGKVATTRVLSHHQLSNDIEYEYSCDMDVKYTKGCGYRGKNKITDHKYKLQWRVHWPSCQAIFNTGLEWSGVDHMTKGGSATTAIEIHEKLFNREPPLLYKYGFVTFHGKKYSKSKGIGMGALELTTLMPSEIIKYILVEPNVQQNKDIDPDGERLIKVYEEVERIAIINTPATRADEKKLAAFRIGIGKIPWKAKFLDMLLNYQIYRDWNEVADRLKDKDGVFYLSKFIEEWIKRGYEPEKYNFTIKQTRLSGDSIAIVKLFSEELHKGMNDLEIHNLVYKVAKDNNILPEALFSSTYNAIIGKDNGPRLGKLIAALGIERTKDLLSYATS